MTNTIIREKSGARKLRATILLMAAGLNVVAIGATTWYVAPGGNDNNDGMSWATAMKSPELCVEKWTETGNTMIISNGTYNLTKTVVTRSRYSCFRSFSGNPGDVILDGQDACRCISIEAANAEISGLTFRRGSSNEGGAVYLRGNGSVISNCVIRNSHARDDAGAASGGGLYIRLALAKNVLVENCSAMMGGAAEKAARGGGVFAFNAKVEDVTVRGCSTTNCYKSAYYGLSAGGGIYVSGTPGQGGYENPAIVENCRIYGCEAVATISTAAGEGGGIATSGPVLVQDCDISCNRATGSGAAIRTLGDQDPNASYAMPTVSGCTITNNFSIRESIVALGAGTTRMTNCYLAENDGTNAVILVNGKNVWVSDCFVTNNMCQYGALEYKKVNPSTADASVVSNCVFAGNTGRGAKYCGLIYTADLLNTNLVVDCRFVGNTCAQRLVWNNRTQGQTCRALWFRNCLFENNRSEASNAILITGNIYNQDGKKLYLENCTFVGNSASGNSSRTVACYSESGNYSESNTIIRACVFKDKTKNAITGGTAPHTFADAQTVSDTCVHDAASLAAIGDMRGNFQIDAEKPLFEDEAGGNYCPAKGSQLCDRVTPEPWMGTGSRNGPMDMGAGYVVGGFGDYGVAISRVDPHRRLSDEKADIGCCEYYLTLGLIILFN